MDADVFFRESLEMARQKFKERAGNSPEDAKLNDAFPVIEAYMVWLEDAVKERAKGPIMAMALVSIISTMILNFLRDYSVDAHENKVAGMHDLLGHIHDALHAALAPEGEGVEYFRNGGTERFNIGPKSEN